MKLYNIKIKQNISSKEKLNFLTNLISYALFFSLIWNYLICDFFLNLPYPWNTPFFIGGTSHFSDFTIPYSWFAKGITFKYGTYGPVGVIIIYIFSLLPLFISLFAFLCIFIVSFYLINYYEFKKIYKSKWQLFCFTFLSFPFLYSIDRANIEIYLFLILWCFIYLFYRKKYYISCIFLALGIGMKFYPIFFLLLFIKKKKYLQLIVCIFISLCIFIIPFTLSKALTSKALTSKALTSKALTSKALTSKALTSNNKTITFLEYFSMLENNFLNFCRNDFYFKNTNKMQEGISLFGVAKIVILKTSMKDLIRLDNKFIIYSYFFICAIIVFITSLYIIFYETSVWENLTLITIIMLLLPFISCPYKLVLLFIPLYFFIKQSNTKNSYMFTVLFGLLLIPKKFYIIHGILTNAGTKYFNVEGSIGLLMKSNLENTLTFIHESNNIVIDSNGISIENILNPILLIFIALLIICKYRTPIIFNYKVKADE